MGACVGCIEEPARTAVLPRRSLKSAESLVTSMWNAKGACLTRGRGCGLQRRTWRRCGGCWSRWRTRPPASALLAMGRHAATSSATLRACQSSSRFGFETCHMIDPLARVLPRHMCRPARCPLRRCPFPSRRDLPRGIVCLTFSTLNAGCTHSLDAWLTLPRQAGDDRKCSDVILCTRAPACAERGLAGSLAVSLLGMSQPMSCNAIGR